MLCRMLHVSLRNDSSPLLCVIGDEGATFLKVNLL